MADLAQLAKDADMCVACGLCVPLCPTWQATRNEAHSPRGRIMMMAQIAAGDKAKADTASCLDACLGCGICEQACPSHVPYMRMLPQAKSVARPRQSLPASLLAKMATAKGRNATLGFMAGVSRALGSLGLGFLLPPGIHDAARAMPSPGKWHMPFGTRTNAGEKVSLFTGCYGPSLEPETLAAATKLLGLCGFDVDVPAKQACCGAIAHHSGDLEKARKCAHANATAFAGSDKVVSCASGCVAQLEDDTQLSAKHEEAGALVARHCQGKLKLRDGQGLEIIVHTPCTQRNLAQKGKWVQELLGLIPGAKLQVMPEEIGCCGAGGLTWLNHPNMSSRIADAAIERIAESIGPNTVIASSNHGCRLQLGAALARRDLKAKIAHPLAIFADHVLETADG